MNEELIKDLERQIEKSIWNNDKPNEMSWMGSKVILLTRSEA